MIRSMWSRKICEFWITPSGPQGIRVSQVFCSCCDYMPSVCVPGSGRISQGRLLQRRLRTRDTSFKSESHCPITFVGGHIVWRHIVMTSTDSRNVIHQWRGRHTNSRAAGNSRDVSNIMGCQQYCSADNSRDSNSNNDIRTAQHSTDDRNCSDTNNSKYDSSSSVFENIQ